ncbi:fumarylacetoacetate hydrolase family protein, partial [Flavobacteriales bacterium]|nr:fumarylacetoacetate hydrolase family protein [Flavobacteriales bacterium]
EFHDLSNIDFHLEINGDTKQVGNTKDMLFSIDKIITEVSKYFTLKIGDLIYTGTPVGVGKVNINDDLKGFIEDQCLFNFKVK